MQELLNQMQDELTNIQEDAAKFAEKGNKAAGGRARKHIGEIKKLVTDYRKASISESKG